MQCPGPCLVHKMRATGIAAERALHGKLSSQRLIPSFENLSRLQAECSVP